MNTILTEEYKGNTITIELDEDPINPREFSDHISTMLCSHNSYALGDETTMDAEEIIEYYKRDDVISLPLYLYDHSGICMSTNNTTYPYNCPWDSGMVGFICVTKEAIRKEYKVKYITKKLLETVLNMLQGEVNEYNRYISGEVYGYTCVDATGEEDSCWGYYNDPEDIIEFIKQGIDAYEKRQLVSIASVKAAKLNYALGGV